MQISASVLFVASLLFAKLELSCGFSVALSSAASATSKLTAAVVGEDLAIHAAPTKTSTVQRHYRTWQWTPDPSKKNTYQINFRTEGMENDGPPILLTHGFGANLNHFRYTIPDLVDAGYRVYAMDLLGFGASEKPKNAASVGFSIELFAQQILDFVSSRNEAQPWVLAGNSMGSLASLAATAEHGNVYFTSAASTSKPFDIAALVLFNSAGGMTGFRYQEVPTWAHGIMGHLQYFLLGRYHGQFLYQAVSQQATIEAALKQGGIYQDTTNLDEELFEILLGPAKDPGASDVFLSVFRGPAGPTRESLVKKIQAPILALWGEDDPFTPFDDAVKALPDLHPKNDFTLLSIPNAGHCPHDEHPEEVNTKMLQFLSDRL